MLFDMENSFTLSHHTPPTDHRSITKPWEWFFCVPGSSARLLACFGRVCVCSDGLCYYLSCVQDVHCVHEWFVLLPIMYLKKNSETEQRRKTNFPPFTCTLILSAGNARLKLHRNQTCRWTYNFA